MFIECLKNVYRILLDFAKKNKKKQNPPNKPPSIMLWNIDDQIWTFSIGQLSEWFCL